MKYLLAFLILSTAHAADLTIDSYDQIKLAHFLRKLPASIAPTSEEAFSGGKRVYSKFHRPGMKIRCMSEYFADAPVPSHTECTMEIDENHQSLEKNYDEWRLPDTSFEVAAALYEIMPHGSVKKSFRAGIFEEGTDFNGRRTNIFDFLFECSKSSCLYRFSEKKIK